MIAVLSFYLALYMTDCNHSRKKQCYNKLLKFVFTES